MMLVAARILRIIMAIRFSPVLAAADLAFRSRLLAANEGKSSHISLIRASYSGGIFFSAVLTERCNPKIMDKYIRNMRHAEMGMIVVFIK